MGVDHMDCRQCKEVCWCDVSQLFASLILVVLALQEERLGRNIGESGGALFLCCWWEFRLTRGCFFVNDLADIFFFFFVKVS